MNAVASAYLDRVPMLAISGQIDTQREPYFTHPVAVAAILTEQRLDDATLVTALLHDTIEDTDTTPEELRLTFGPEITAIGMPPAISCCMPYPSRTWKDFDSRPSAS